DSYRYYWCYIPHFIHSPFYVYAYAFGDCLVNSLYAAYEDAHHGFAERYLTLLRAGGTLRHKELLAPFNLDAADPAFWSKGLAVITRFIDELEALDRPPSDNLGDSMRQLVEPLGGVELELPPRGPIREPPDFT